MPDKSKPINRQHIIFTLDNEYYAVEIEKIKEIIGYKALTRIPNMPHFMKGVIDIRGEAVPVIDIRNKFSLPDREYDNFTVVLVLHIRGKTIGTIVDNVSDVIHFKEEEIQPAPKFSMSAISDNYVAGVVKQADHFVIILDIDRILMEDEINVI